MLLFLGIFSLAIFISLSPLSLLFFFFTVFLLFYFLKELAISAVFTKTNWNFSCICTRISHRDPSRSLWPRASPLLYLPAHPLALYLSFLPHLSLRIRSTAFPVHRDDWRIDSSRVVQSGLRHRVCVFQKCWRRLSRRSSSPPRPPSSPSFTPPIAPPLFSATSSLFASNASPPRLKINGSSARGRASENPRRPKSASARNRGIARLRVFDPSSRTRGLYLISPL